MQEKGRTVWLRALVAAAIVTLGVAQVIPATTHADMGSTGPGLATTGTSTAPTSAPATTVPQPAPASSTRVQIMVTFRPSTSSPEADALVNQLGGKTARDIPQIHTRVVDVPAEAADHIIAAFAAKPEVQHAQRTVTFTKASTPDDPGYGQQWALPRIAWDQAYGSVTPGGHATIAILDTGIEATHPDLSAVVNTAAGVSEVGGNPNTDPNGHGTELAGIAAAAVNNGIGMAGIDYAGASLVSIQVLGSDGTGSDASVVPGIIAAENAGANVILMAFSSPSYSAALAAAIADAESKGIVVVAATGNSASNVATYPAGDPGVIGVAATDQNDNLVSTSDLVSADVAAPGASIYATQPGGNYGFVSGTSPASAEVAGLAGLLIANGDNATQTYSQITGATDPISGQTFGRIDVLKALGGSATVTPVPTASTTPTPGPTATYVASSNSSISGHVYNGLGTTGISGATVTCINCTVNSHQSTSTDANGAYPNSGSFKPDFSGSANLQLCASASGFNSQIITIQAPGGSSSFTNVDFHLTTGSNGTCPTTSGTPTKLAFVSPPQTLTAGVASSAITVQLQDANGNPVVPASTVNITLSTNSTAGTFSPTSVSIPTNSSDANGFTYTDTIAGTPTITASTTSTVCGTVPPGCTSATQQETVTAASATKLVFGQQPTTAVAGTTIAPAVTVKIEDQFGNIVTSSSASVSLAITAGTGTTGAVLSGDGGTAASAGLATFGALSINLAGTNYTLTASSNGLTSATSSQFNITTRSTSTSVTCAPNPVAINTNTTCTAIVTDNQGSGTASTPAGTVAWTTTTSSGFSFSSGSCTLSGGSCSVTYKQSTTGTPTITGTYSPNDNIHAASNGTFNLTVGLRSTSTSVSCSPSTVDANSPTTCTATVTDTAGGTASTPGGTVAFSVSPSNGSFSAGASCTLSGSGASATCSVTYTPSVTGSPAVSAAYTANDGLHINSSTTTGFTVTVNARSTATAVNCAPSTVDVGVTTTCTATVSDTDSNGSPVFPDGSVSWTVAPSGSGSFSNSASCTLTHTGGSGISSCQVTYTPGSSSSPQGITASFTPTDNVHSGSSNATAFSLTVNKRTVNVTVSCTPGAIDVGVGTSCTATVADNDAGAGSTPTGTITWSVSPSANGGFSNSGSCTLSSGSCTVTYTPTATGSPTIQASYGGDSTHRSGSNTTSVSVSTRTTTTTVSCAPSTVDANTGTTCTATVTDTDSGTKSTPSGTVNFSVSPSSNGSFSSGGGCVLSTQNSSTATCAVTYTPSAAGSPQVSASYNGDSAHSASSTTTAFTVTVNLRSTSTTVTCATTTVTVNSGTTCTATVTDTDANGSKTSPTGTVSWSVSPANGSFTAAAGSTFSGGPPPTCTLTGASGSTAACSVTYTASTYGSPTVSGAYSGDAAHATSNGSLALTATVGLCAGATTTSLAMCGVSLTAGFPTLTLNGQNQTAFASLSNVNIQDQQTTGTAGWNVTVQASRLACTSVDGPRCPAGGDTLPAGELLMAGPLAEGPSGSTCVSGCGVGGPLSLPRGTTPFLIDAGASVKIASYANGDPSYTLKLGTVDGTTGHTLKATLPADAYATTYHTTITLTVATGP